MVRLVKSFASRVYGAYRRRKYRLLSVNRSTGAAPKTHQPLILAGKGTIKFHENVNVGLVSSPNFWSTSCYIEARHPDSMVEIGENSWINNNFSAISERGLISIGRDCLIGHDVYIIDSDFHLLDPDLRHTGGKSQSQPVIIGDNVFVGSRVTILKNTHIGEGSVVAAGSIVSGEFPPRSLIAGNPAKLARRL
jgi:maltose O-acetyltransferase